MCVCIQHAPSAQAFLARQRPMPLEAPVMTSTFPSSGMAAEGFMALGWVERILLRVVDRGVKRAANSIVFWGPGALRPKIQSWNVNT